MTNPEFVEENTVCLTDVKEIIDKVEKRDKELNYRSNKAKEFLESFPVLSKAKREELKKKLVGLDLTRLKEEYINKIIDYPPQDVNDLKVVLLAYPLSLPKKDQDSIIGAVKDFI